MNSASILRLEDLLAPLPIQCGLHVISGTRALVPLMEDMLTQFLGAEWATGEEPILGSVYWIDSGNYFSAFDMADMAKRRGIDPKMVLRMLKVARPFTAFQFQMMMDKIPGTPPLSSRVPMVVVSDLMGLFYDPELQEEDLRRAFREFLTKLMKLQRRAVVVALLLDHDIPPQREFLLPRVLEMADHIHGRGPLPLPAAWMKKAV